MRNIYWLLAAIHVFRISLLADTNTPSNVIREDILAIERKVVDLTDVTCLLRCNRFLETRKYLTEQKAREIVQMIADKRLEATSVFIGIFLIAVLPEHTYWNVTLPLLNSNTDQTLLSMILLCPFPYGPGYANAYRSEKHQNALLRLAEAPKISTEVKALIKHILDGKASKDYNEYKRDPGQYGYPSTTTRQQ